MHMHTSSHLLPEHADLTISLSLWVCGSAIDTCTCFLRPLFVVCRVVVVVVVVVSLFLSLSLSLCLSLCVSVSQFCLWPCPSHCPETISETNTNDHASSDVDSHWHCKWQQQHNMSMDSHGGQRSCQQRERRKFAALRTQARCAADVEAAPPVVQWHMHHTTQPRKGCLPCSPS
jgi:hypothetical protein